MILEGECFPPTSGGVVMISKYKVNIAGPYHIENGIPCQDAYCIRETVDGVVVAAVADGLGSEEHSDRGAKVASNYVVTYCAKHYQKDMTDNEVAAMLKRAYSKAYVQVERIANRDGNDVDQYDCTLCTVIYDGKNVFYGQSGDSGMIVGSNDGSYYKITEQQRDEDGNVYPLCFGPEYWEFGRVDGNVVSVMLMTDGVLDQACPKLLKSEKQPVNVGFVEMFMNHYGRNESEIKSIEREAFSYMRNFPRERLDDDKTIVVLINSEAKPLRKEDDYYASPNWNSLIQDRDRRIRVPTETVKLEEECNDDIPNEDISVMQIPIDLTVASKAIKDFVDKVDKILIPNQKIETEEVKKKIPKEIHIDIKV